MISGTIKTGHLIGGICRIRLDLPESGRPAVLPVQIPQLGTLEVIDQLELRLGGINAGDNCEDMDPADDASGVATVAAMGGLPSAHQ